MELLAEQPNGLHFSELWTTVVSELPLADEDAERLKSGDTRGENSWKWQTSDLVMAGWLRKNNGVWRITALGREALRECPDAADFYDGARDAYNYWQSHKHGFAYAQKLVGAIPDGRSLDLDTLAAETRLDRGRLARWLWGARPKGSQWVHGAQGTIALEVRADERERAEFFAELDSWESLGEDVQLIEVRELQTRLAEKDSRTRHARSAWLLRGSHADHPGVVLTWRYAGNCSLAAEWLGPVDGPITAEELRLRVEEGYRYLPISRRDELAAAFQTFLHRVHPGDLVCVLSEGEFYLGTISGPAIYVDSGAPTQLRRDVDWMDVAISQSDLPEEIQGLLASQHDLVDMTSLLDVLTALMPTALPDDDSRAEQTEPSTPSRSGRELPFPEPTLAEKLLVTPEWLGEVRDLLQDRQQLIFYGPPGTGKTYLAQHIAEHLAGDPRAVKLVQFHPSYAYEDFFEGFRPTVRSEDGTGTLTFALRPGPFRKLVDLAEEDPSTPYFLIIDEINRANLAKVFGELYFVLEYRNRPVDLQYSGEFLLPRNVFVIGTMNTADRSIALVDAAMRRRFAFVALHPDEEPTDEMLARWIERRTSTGEIEPAEDVAALHRELNRRIEDKDFRIGPSYLMRPSAYAPGGLERVWRHAILPLLEEHHYGDDSVDIEARYGLATLRRAVSTTASEPGDDS
ncbi:AAA family ATPase [Streptomyces sp. NPDC096013]|uniref:AAA family ATPase n=1 Tax=Streptomyces sp. NPDC096013 TaxID=3366069 RepID=UPI00382EA696